MALYNFHRVLIITAILFDLVFSFWCFRQWQHTDEAIQLIMAVASSVVTIGLIGYLIYFNKSLIVRRGMLTTMPTHSKCGSVLPSTAAENPTWPTCGSPLPHRRGQKVTP